MLTCRGIVAVLAAVSPFVSCSSGSTVGPSSSAPLGIAIVHHSTTVPIGAVEQFSATISAPVGFSSSGISQSVAWSVAGPGCSGTSCGTIDATGKYTAPATVPEPPTVTVTATSAVARWPSTVMIVIVAVAGESLSLSVSPDGIAFGDQTVNTTSAPKTVTLTNTGGVTQPVGGRINGSPGMWQNFAQTNDCPSGLAPGASCTFTITFTPSATGNRAATLYFDGFFDEEAFVNLGGTGTN